MVMQCLSVFGAVGCGDAVFECVWWCWCVVMQCLSSVWVCCVW